MQETRDGELVVLHDLQRVLEASRHATINDAVIAQLAAEVDDVSRAQVQVGRRRYLQCLMNLDCPYSELDYKHTAVSNTAIVGTNQSKSIEKLTCCKHIFLYALGVRAPGPCL